MGVLLERLMKQVKQEMDERISILAPKIDGTNKKQDEIISQNKNIIELLKKIEVNTRR